MSAEVAGRGSPWVAVAPRTRQLDAEPVDEVTTAYGDGEPMTADDGLARGFVAGDRACLEEAYRRWSPLVHTLALREVRTAADAEDVTQQVFVSAWRSRADYAPERGSLAGWLVGITRHRLVDHHRRHQRQLRLVTTLESEAVTTPAEGPPPERDLERLVLVAEIQQLPDPRGTILRMAYWEGYTYAQIAEGLGLPLGTVKSHARRALLHLRSRLKEAAAWPT